MIATIRQILIVIILLTAWAGFFMPLSEKTSGYLLSISTEALGIFITVEIVERLLKMERKNEKASKMANHILQDVDFAVWVWHGGRRAFDIGELITILESSLSEHILHGITRSLMANIGTRARSSLTIDREILQPHAALRRALGELSKLVEHADHGDFPNVETRDILLRAVNSLAIFLNLSYKQFDRQLATWLTDPSPTEQLARFKRS